MPLFLDGRCYKEGTEEFIQAQQDSNRRHLMPQTKCYTCGGPMHVSEQMMENGAECFCSAGCAGFIPQAQAEYISDKALMTIAKRGAKEGMYPEYIRQCKGVPSPISFDEWYERIKDERKKHKREKKMAKINDGGSAFPDNDNMNGGSSGMSLREYLAAKAMQGLVSATCKDKGTEDLAAYPLAIATAAYLIADAMLKARENKKE